MKTYCIYHRTDLDGHCSGAIVKYKYPHAIMIPMDYPDPWDISKIEPGSQVFMVDFSLSGSLMMELDFKSKEFFWIDHHVSAIEGVYEFYDTKNYSRPLGLRDVTHAACELTWLFLNEGVRMPRGVRFLGRWDVWDHLDPQVIPFQYSMRMRETDPIEMIGFLFGVAF